MIKQITQEDISVLQNSVFQNTVFAVKTDKGKKYLTSFNKEEANSWINIFKRCFNCGVLANTTTSLIDVTTYLNQFDWSVEKGIPGNQTAYDTVCKLANKALINGVFDKCSSYVPKCEISGKSLPINLFVNVGIDLDVQFEEIDTTEKNFARKARKALCRDQEKNIYWNPELQVIHLQKLLQTDSNSLFYIWHKNKREFLTPKTSISNRDFNKIEILIFKNQTSVTKYFEKHQAAYATL